MIVYIVTVNHEDGNDSVWSTLDAAIVAAVTLVIHDARVYEAWIEERVLDGGPPDDTSPTYNAPFRVT